jgi:hypothetical protein
MLTTTLNRIRSHGPCEDGWRDLLNYLGKTEADDEPLPFATIVHSNGLDDALWCCRAEPQHADIWREFALWCAEQVRPLMPDQRSTDVLDTVRRYLDGEAEEEEMADVAAAARDASSAAWAAAWAAADDARTAAWAAETALASAATTTRATETDAWAAADDARTAADAANLAAKAADDAEDAQRRKFLELVGLDTEQTLV